MVPEKLSVAGPVMDIVPSSFQQMRSRPPLNRRSFSLPARPVRQAAVLVAQAPVPQAKGLAAAPLPYAHGDALIGDGGELDVGFLGKYGMRLEEGAGKIDAQGREGLLSTSGEQLVGNAAQSSTRQTAWGFPMETHTNSKVPHGESRRRCPT